MTWPNGAVMRTSSIRKLPIVPGLQNMRIYSVSLFLIYIFLLKLSWQLSVTPFLESISRNNFIINHNKVVWSKNWRYFKFATGDGKRQTLQLNINVSVNLLPSLCCWLTLFFFNVLSTSGHKLLDHKRRVLTVKGHQKRQINGVSSCVKWKRIATTFLIFLSYLYKFMECERK